MTPRALVFFSTTLAYTCISCALEKHGALYFLNQCFADKLDSQDVKGVRSNEKQAGKSGATKKARVLDPRLANMSMPPSVRVAADRPRLSLILFPRALPAQFCKPSAYSALAHRLPKTAVIPSSTATRTGNGTAPQKLKCAMCQGEVTRKCDGCGLALGASDDTFASHIPQSKASKGGQCACFFFVNSHAPKCPFVTGPFVTGKSCAIELDPTHICPAIRPVVSSSDPDLQPDPKGKKVRSDPDLQPDPKGKKVRFA